MKGAATKNLGARRLGAQRAWPHKTYALGALVKGAATENLGARRLGARRVRPQKTYAAYAGVQAGLEDW